MSIERRRQLVNRNHKLLSITKQCRVLGLNRSTYYHKSKGESIFNLDLMRKIDEQYMQTPFYGTRQMTRHLANNGISVGRRRVKRLMRKMGITAIYPKPKTSKPNLEHRIYPYLLRDLCIDKPNQVWCSDITYIPMKRGFMYLVAVMDWYSRAVLSWKLSNTLETDFCVNALEEALYQYGVPEIFNTDQGSQFTSREFTDALKNAGTRISMDGKGRWLDNVFIERLWRSLKYESIYLNDLETGGQTKKLLEKWFNFYNWERPHSVHNGKRVMEIYLNKN